MALAARNEPCPCGSGRKFKRCCGFDRTTELMLEERLAAVEQIAGLAFRSKRLVPDSDAYDAWVHAIVASLAERDMNAAIAALGPEEPVRILSACLELYPDEWQLLSARCGDEREAVGALLGGAVAAGIRDLRPVERFAVEAIEGSADLADDPLEALAMCLDGEQLWDRDEGAEAEQSIRMIPDWFDDDAYEHRWNEILGATAARLATEWHARRLARLVRRIEDRLPWPELPRASTAVEGGCERFAADPAARAQLAATLLGDMVGRDALASIRARLLAA